MKLFSILVTFIASCLVQADQSAPALVAAWAAGPLDVRLAFDRPVDRQVLDGLTERTITFSAVGDKAADAPKALAGANAAGGQNGTPGARASRRGTLHIAAASLSSDGRTLLLTTDPHPLPTTYTLSLPHVRALGAPGTGKTAEVRYNLSGLDAAWEPAQENAKQRGWSLWWPLLDPDLVPSRTKGSADHERAHATLNHPGKLTLTALLTLPEGEVTLAIEASGPFEADLGEEPIASKPAGTGSHRLQLKVESTGVPVLLVLKAATGTGGKPLALHVSYHTAADSKEKSPALDSLQVPWAPPPPPEPSAAAELPADLDGGDPVRGEAVFKSSEARCSACHKVRGQGGTVGPDLSDLRRSDLASVYRDIREPSALIHPDYASYVVALRDGQVVTGIVRAQGADAIRVTDTDAKERTIPRAEIEELRPTHSSIMPEGLVGALGEGKMRDLIAFLLASGKATRE
ncbi:MAG TPA: heme-binding domain-containing protein [Isosphaeraceae bacterium]|nr:heme-binding domain-containing protein [Isosphaeraceae bacterium]